MSFNQESCHAFLLTLSNQEQSSGAKKTGGCFFHPQALTQCSRKMDDEGNIFFLRLAAPITNRVRQPLSNQAKRKFKRTFGVSAQVCAFIWIKLYFANALEPDIRPIHYLWALMFLRQYQTEEMQASHVKADENSQRVQVEDHTRHC